MPNQRFNWTTGQIAEAVNGTLQGESIPVNGISTDSRSIGPGEIFIALVGPNFDGHEFIQHAQTRRAAAVMISQDAETVIPAIRVQDTRIALGELASAWRKQFSIPLIAITGSNGKTTVKEMIASIQRCERETLSTHGNLNNDIGVPLTLLRLNHDHQAAVIEMGANHHGEIAYLTKLTRPDVALITNAGPAHLEGFGDIEGVARAKGEIYSGLSESGTAVINADDTYADYWRSLCRDVQVVSFGLQSEADVSATYETGVHHTQLQLSTPQGEIDVSLPALGMHNVMNALAATAASLATGVSLNSIKAGLEQVRNVAGRFQLKKGKSGSRIIDDTYNANPASLGAALDVLQTFPGHHYLAIGDMGELGKNTEQLHRDAGKQARDSGVRRLFAIGQYAKYVTQSFGGDAQEFTDHGTMITAISGKLNHDVTLLVKGSRLMQMEKIVNALVANGETG